MHEAVDAILSAYEVGALTRQEQIAALIQLITPATVDAILASIPPEIVDRLLAWAQNMPATGGVVVGGELSSEAEQIIAERSLVAAQSLRRHLGE